MTLSKLSWIACLCLAVAAPLAQACQDPCVTLAERICNCEKDPDARRECRTQRIVNRQSSTTIDDADRNFCEAKLDTCDCTAIDTNDLDACGFVPEADSE